MWRVVAFSLVFVCGLSATELYWDDDEASQQAAQGCISIRSVYVAVLFHDAEGEDGPGDTGGQAGMISILKCDFDFFANPAEDSTSYSYSPTLYIYSRGDDDNPGEILAGPLVYTAPLHDLKEPVYNAWHTLTLNEPVEVPPEFFIVIKLKTSVLRADFTHDWEYNHSRTRTWDVATTEEIFEGIQRLAKWQTLETDLRIRVEWEPSDPEP
ncbi:MAG: hypothetical protein NTW26_08155 [bacterium]|nr:hypothetical protein [bacterium]